MKQEGCDLHLGLCDPEAMIYSRMKSEYERLMTVDE